MPIGAILSGGAALLGVGSTLLNNHQQQKNFDRQMDFAKYQYEDMKRYNSMQAQVARMRAAGINPALALGSGQLGTAQGSVANPSAPSFDSVAAGDMMSGASLLTGVGSEINLRDTQAQGNAIDNLTRAIKNWIEIDKGREEIQGKQYENDVKRFESNYGRLMQMYNLNVRNQMADTANKRAAANYNEALTGMVDLEYNWMPQQWKAKILRIGSEVARNYAEGAAATKNAAANQTAAKAAMIQALKQEGIHFDNPEQEKKFVEGALRRMWSAGYVRLDQGDDLGISFDVGERGVGFSNKNGRKRTWYYSPYDGKYVKLTD